MNSKITCLALFLLAGLSHLSAQAPPEEHKVQFRTLGWQISTDDLYYDLKHHDTSMAVDDCRRSIFYDAPLPTDGPIVFYRFVTGPDNKKAREIVATVDISSAGPKPLLLFMADPKVPKHYRVTAIDDDPKTFPFPSCRFVNLTGVKLHGTYGDQKFDIKGHDIQLIEPHLKSKGKPETRYTSVIRDLPEGPQLLYGNNWVVYPTNRTLVFIFTQDDNMEVMRVGDDANNYVKPPGHPK